MAEIFLDMDGVLVGLYDWIDRWIDKVGMDWDRFRFWDFYFKVREIYPNWWGDAPPTRHCYDLLKLADSLVGRESVHILTAVGPKDFPPEIIKEVKKQKARWIKKNGIRRYVGGDILMVYRGEKKKYADEDHILVDDHLSNVKPWIRRGGIGILYDDDTFFKHKRELIEAVESAS